LLEKAVERRMISDVPLGALLSGGLDSSLIVANMCKINMSTSERIKTYSIGFGVEGYDESYYAQLVADHCGVDHLSLTLGQDDYMERLRRAIIQKDAPLSIPHEIALMNVCSELKKHTTVVISGEGADELFGGYGRVQRSPMDFKKIDYVKNFFPRSFHKPLLKSMGAGKNSESWAAINSHMEHFFSVYNWIPFEEKWDIFTDSVMEEINYDESSIKFWQRDFDKVSGGNEYDKILYLFEKNHLRRLGVNALSVDGDIARNNYKAKLGFSRSDIAKNNRRIFEYCSKEKRNYDCIIVSVISPIDSIRKQGREMLSPDFFLVYVSASINSLRARDTKGLYKKADNGEIDNLIGYSESSPYDVPSDFDYIVDTSNYQDKEQSIKDLIAFVEEKMMLN